MKHFSILILILLLNIGYGISQTTLISQDFDTLQVGSGIAAQVGAPFSTWSGAVGGSEDLKVSNEQSFSSPNSLKVVANNDGVINLSDITTGRYMMNFKIWVEPNYVAYYNLLQDFAGNNSVWGTQVFFYKDGTGSLDANAEAAASFTYTPGTWIDVQYIIDLDDDYGTLYLNQQKINSWVWSKGSFGSNSLQKFDAINFYGWSDDTGTPSRFYIDDFSLKTVNPPSAPGNLQVIAAGNMTTLTWSAPLVGIPDAYSISRNDVLVLDEMVLGNSWIDENLYPNTYTYKVRAHYPMEGYSHSSNSAEGIITGGVERDLVLLEINTGTWCTYCPGAAKGADDMVANEHRVAVIEYHNEDDFVVPDATARENYYNVGGFPTNTFDGVSGFAGGNATTSIYNSYLPYYNARENYPSVLLMDINLTQISPTEFTIDGTVTESNAFFGNTLTLRAALTESHIPHNWLAGLTEVNFVCKKMYPDAAGTALDFSTNTSHDFSFDVNTTGMVTDNCEFVVFVQHDATKEVVQTNKLNIVNLISIAEHSTTSMNVYPNPSEGIFTLDIFAGKSQSYQIEVMDVRGKRLKTFDTQNANFISKQLDIRDLSRGIYFIRITGDDESVMKQIQIK